MADLRLGVKIGVSGGAESVKQIKGLDDQVKRLQDQNNKAAATAKALSESYNLNDVEVGQLINQLRKLENQTEETSQKAKDAAQEIGKQYNLSAGQVASLAKRLDSIDFQIDKDGKLRNAQGQFIKIKDEVAKLDGQLIKTRESASLLDNAFTGIAQGFGQQLTQTSFQALRDAGQAVTQTFEQAINAVSEFEAARAAASTLTNDVDGLVSALESAQGRLQNQVTTNELLASSYDILSAGFTDAADAAVIAEEAARGAIAGFSDAGTVADALTTILNAYGKSSEDAAAVVDQLVKTQDLGKITIDQYAKTVGRAASIAATAGVSFEEFSASVAAATAAGVPAESAVSGTRQAIVNLLKPTADAEKILAQFGISNAQATLKSEGLIGVLRRLAEQDPTSEQLSKIFTDVDALSAIAPVAGQNLGKLESALGQINTASGSADRAIAKITDTLPNLAKQLRVAFQEGLRQVGQSFEPAITAFLEFTQQVLTTASQGSIGLNLIAEAGQRLYDVLSNSPELVAQLASAFTQVGSAISQGIAEQLDRITTALQNNPELINDLVSSFTSGAQQLIQFASTLGQIAGSLATVGASFAGAGASVFSSIAPTLISLVETINAAVQALQPLLANTQLVEIAFQALLIRMVAIKAVGLANSFIGIATGLASLLKGAVAATASLGALNVAQATGSKSALLLAQSLAGSGAAATTAAAGFRAAAVSAAAATGPFVALAAAIATANLIKTTQELRFTNDELDAFANGVEVAATQGFNFANKLNSINDSIAASGGKATTEQRKQLEEYVRLSESQIEELKRQLSEVQSIEPKNDSQRNAQQNLTNQLQTTIGALEKQITEADGALTQVSSGLGDKTGKAFSDGVKQGIGDAPEQAVKSALDGIKEEVDASLSDLELASAQARAAILESGGDPAKLAQQEQKSLKDRIQANKDFLAQLKELTPAEGEDAQKTADQIRQVELSLANDRVALAQQVLEAKVKAAEDAAKQETDRLKEIRDAEKAAAEQDFQKQQTAQNDQFAEEERSRQDAFNQTQQDQQKAFNESQRQADKAFQQQQQAAEKAFQKSQQAESQRFQEQLDAKRDRGNREFDALQKEVERRTQLANATGAERANLQKQFQEEDRQAKERRKIEQQVLNQRGSVLASQGDLLDQSPLEQARAEFEKRLQQEQQAFQEQQQLAQEAFQLSQQLAQEQFEATKRQQQEQFDLAQREAQRAFDDEQRGIQRAFEVEQQAAEAAFNAQQRQLDEQSAQRQAAILEAASRGIAPQVQARRDGGPVAAGQAYLVGEDGPELITPTRRGWVHTAGETAAMMAKQPSLAVKPQSMAGVEATLSELLQEVRKGRRVVAPTSFTLNTQNPLNDAVELQIKQVRALARGRRL